MKKFNANDLVTPLPHTLTLKILGQSVLLVADCDGDNVTVIYGNGIELNVPTADVDRVENVITRAELMSNSVWTGRRGERYFKAKGITCKEALSALLSKQEFTFDTQKPDGCDGECEDDPLFTGSLDMCGEAIYVGDVWTDNRAIYDVVSTDDGFMFKSRSQPEMKGVWAFAQQGYVVSR